MQNERLALERAYLALLGLLKAQALALNAEDWIQPETEEAEAAAAVERARGGGA